MLVHEVKRRTQEEWRFTYKRVELSNADSHCYCWEFIMQCTVFHLKTDWTVITKTTISINGIEGFGSSFWAMGHFVMKL